MIRKEVMRDIFEIATIGRALRVAMVVGTVLVFINHYDIVFEKNITPREIVQIGLNYCVPYIVSTHGQISAKLAVRTNAIWK